MFSASFIGNLIGLIGVALILVAYWFSQIGRMQADDLAFPVLNLIGSIGILYSLLFSWNLSSFVIEVAWIVISIYGIHRALEKKKSMVRR